MFNYNPFSRQTPIALFFSFGQSMIFGLLEGCLAVFMKFHHSLITNICQDAKLFRELTGIVFEELEVLFASVAKGCGYDLGTFSGSDHIKFRWIFSPVHQGHQQLIGSTQLWRSPEVSQSFHNDCEYLLKGFSLYACQAFEICVFKLSDCLIVHAPIMPHLCKRSNVP